MGKVSTLNTCKKILQLKQIIHIINNITILKQRKNFTDKYCLSTTTRLTLWKAHKFTDKFI